MMCQIFIPKASPQPSPPKKKRLSAAQLRWMLALMDGQDPYDGLHGRSQHGGASATRFSLQRLGLIDANNKITKDAKDLIVPHLPKARW